MVAVLLVFLYARDRGRTPAHPLTNHPDLVYNFMTINLFIFILI